MLIVLIWFMLFGFSFVLFIFVGCCGFARFVRAFTVVLLAIRVGLISGGCGFVDFVCELFVLFCVLWFGFVWVLGLLWL